MARLAEFKAFRDMTRIRPPSILMGKERATVQLSSKETVQIKLPTPQIVNASTDKLKALGGDEQVPFFVIKTKRQTRAERQNRIIMPFGAYSPTTGVNKPTRLKTRATGGWLLRLFFKL